MGCPKNVVGLVAKAGIKLYAAKRLDFILGEAIKHATGNRTLWKIAIHQVARLFIASRMNVRRVSEEILAPLTSPAGLPPLPPRGKGAAASKGVGKGQRGDERKR